jgi:hypothetical protein
MSNIQQTGNISVLANNVQFKRTIKTKTNLASLIPIKSMMRLCCTRVVPSLSMRHLIVDLIPYCKSIQMAQSIFMLVQLLTPSIFIVLNLTRKPEPPFMGVSAICDFLRENEELQSEQELV